MVTDISKSSTEQFFATLQQENQNEIDESKLLIKEISPLVDHPSGDNTEIVIAAKPNSGYVGEVTVTYNRNTLEALYEKMDSPVLITRTSTGATPEEILSMLNEAGGSNLAMEEDVITFTIPPIVHGGTVVTIEAAEDSVAYIGQADILVELDETVPEQYPYTLISAPGVFPSGFFSTNDRIRTLTLVGVAL